MAIDTTIDDEIDITATCGNCTMHTMISYESKLIKDVIVIKVTCTHCMHSFNIKVK